MGNLSSVNSESGTTAGRAVFKSKYIEQARNLAQLGATDQEVADVLGVSRRSIARWKLAHPDFGQAMAVGKEPADERVVRSLYQRAIGFHYTEQRAFKVKTGPHEERIEIVEIERYMPGDLQACAMWLKSRRRAEWRDGAGDGATGHDGARIFAQITIDQVIGRLKTLDDAC